MADKRSGTKTRRSTTPKVQVPVQGKLGESSRLPKRSAGSPASRVVGKGMSRLTASARSVVANSAQARALLRERQGTPGAGTRTTGEGANPENPVGTRRSRAPSAEDLARDAVRKERALTGGPMRDLNLRLGREVTGRKRVADSVAARTAKARDTLSAAGTRSGGRANTRTRKDRGGTSLRTRR